MSTTNKYAIIGFGKMGSAIYKSLHNIIPVKQIFVCDKHAEKKSKIFAKNFSTDPNKILGLADIIIFAVKPQSFMDLANQITIDLSKKIVISIMAGVSIKQIRNATKAKKIVRAMPNLPAQIAQGVVGWTATKEVSAKEKKLVATLFQTLGFHVQLKKEKMIDAVTALSGSGPAYFFYLCELLQSKAKQMGFSQNEAKKIAEQTFVGSANLLEQNNLSAQQWREAVTSKGGTTAAALAHMSDKGFNKIFAEAIEKASRRAAELSKS